MGGGCGGWGWGVSFAIFKGKPKSCNNEHSLSKTTFALGLGKTAT